MSNSIFSSSWYRVAELKPRVRHHGQIHRHDYRDQIWFVLQDRVSGRSHRFTKKAYRFIGAMDGHRSVQQIWDGLNEIEGDDAPTQDEVIRLLSQLHAADLLICDVNPDTQELFRRYQRQRRMNLKQRLWTPLAIRIPLFDPDRFLDRTLPTANLILNRYTAFIWLIVISLAAVLAAVNWSSLSENVIDRALTPQNLLVLWLVYPAVKALHELAHAYIAKKYGAEVHEIGIMFLVLMPVPYVDVSPIWAFRDKRKRMLVGAAGIAMELFLGAIALFVWLNVEVGAVHSIAFNVMLISGISTLLFNGNPLLRFDGYYVFSDAIEIPNLGSRSTKYLGYVIQRYLIGIKDAVSPANNAGEKAWFVVYGIAGFLYRIFIMFVIILYIGGKFFTVGIALAAWAIVTQAIIPLVKSMSFLVNNPKLKQNRSRANVFAFGLVASIVLVVFVVPAPSWTKAQGVTWPADNARVRAQADGFVDQILVADRSYVEQGQAIILTVDPLAESRVSTLEARLKQLQVQWVAARTSDRVQAGLIQEELSVIREDLKRAKEKVQNLTVRSPKSGLLIIPQAKDIPGKYVTQGEGIAFVISDDDEINVRAVVAQEDIGMVREYVRKVDVIASDYGAKSYSAKFIREVHGGSKTLPSAALGDVGGGEFVVSRSDKSGRSSMESVFEIELSLPAEARTDFIGGRVYVRFDHGYEALGFQAWRFLRQLFLRRFGV